MSRYAPVERTADGIRAALAAAAPDELVQFEAELRGAGDDGRIDRVLDRWWGVAHLRLNPTSDEERAVVEQVGRGDFTGLPTSRDR